MRILGIDYGEKRVGLALSDETGVFALPLTVIQNSSRLVEEVATICREREVGKIVIGESKNWRGEPNPIMKRIEHFKKELEKTSGLPVVFEPEILTSAEAERIQGKTADLDASAAALILDGYLKRIKAKKLRS